MWLPYAVSVLMLVSGCFVFYYGRKQWPTNGLGWDHPITYLAVPLWFFGLIIFMLALGKSITGRY